MLAGRYPAIHSSQTAVSNNTLLRTKYESAIQGNDGVSYRTIEISQEISSSYWKDTRLRENDRIKVAVTVFLISDTHLDDPHILDKSPRSFDDIAEMNELIVQNWKKTVNESDSVLFGGDLAHSGIDKEGFYKWVYELGSIGCILRGNHDPYERSELSDASLPIVESEEFTYSGFKFYCCHKYSGIPEEFDGWSIHGHHHHKRPFIDTEHQRVNISVDVLGYKPISLDEVIQYIKQEDSLEERPTE
jgi:calcineurin-like phosphoesterase family protein